jgi:hypothetical protein
MQNKLHITTHHAQVRQLISCVTAGTIAGHLHHVHSVYVMTLLQLSESSKAVRSLSDMLFGLYVIAHSYDCMWKT